MPIEFTTNDRPTIGIEVELHLVDAVTGDLVSAANEVLDEMGASHPGGEHPTAKHELFQSTVEIITAVCETPAEAHRDLTATLDELREVTEPRGVVPISSGTHPFALARDQLVSPSPRYHDLIEAMQWPARRLLICGMHVHVGVSDGGEEDFDFAERFGELTEEFQGLGIEAAELIGQIEDAQQRILEL